MVIHNSKYKLNICEAKTKDWEFKATTLYNVVSSHPILDNTIFSKK